MQCMLTRSVELLLNFSINTPQYLIKNSLSHTILVIYLEIDLSKKFNLNLRYILIKTLDLDNQDDALYKASFTKLVDILQSNNFVTIKSKDKL